MFFVVNQCDRLTALEGDFSEVISRDVFVETKWSELEFYDFIPKAPPEEAFAFVSRLNRPLQTATVALQGEDMLRDGAIRENQTIPFRGF